MLRRASIARALAKTSGKRRWPRLLAVVLGVALLLVGVGVADAWTAIGTRPEASRLEQLARSSRFRDGKFVDTLPRVEPDFWAALMRWLRGTDNSQPTGPLPIVRRKRGDFLAPPPNGLRVTWLGHSTLLVEIESKRLLLDPIWGERCSPSRFVGPKRFHAPPLPFEQLPPIDAVLISHDHYDHLEHATVVELAAQGARFFVPLGVAAHLEYWGVDRRRIHELDWWQEARLEPLTLVATPARHFSGRGLGQDATLWSGWAVIGKTRRAYYSGDTAMFPGFTEIGQRLGPFDVTMIEVGAYDAMWADVHLGPEQAVAAHRDVRGDVMIPVHWATFDLALHSWIEPGERVLAAARAAGVRVAVPRPGQSIEPATPLPLARWWPELPWKTAAQAPVVSSGLR